jgi:serine protease Do
MGVSFAIPMEIALDVINQLKNTGMVSRGWIGVFIQEVNADLASSFKLPSPQGALVAEVMETGPAAQRIKPGDIILSFNGKPIVHAADLPPLVGASVVGSQAHLKVLRDGTAQLLDIPVAELPKNRFIDPTHVPSPNLQRALPETLGMQLSALDTETRAALQMNNGVRVDQVLGEVARRAGMLEGDIITQLDGQSITTPDQFKQVVASLTQQKVGQMIAVLIQRDGIARFLAIKIEANARE